MSPQLRKEIRCVLPAAIAALVIPIGVQLCLGRTHYVANDGLPFFALFTALLAASSFGFEWTYGTLPLLLTQPVRRADLWLYKSAVLATLLAVITAAFTLCTFHPANQFPLLLLAALAAFGITPWLTLLFRDGLIATAITLLIEWVIFALAWQMFRWRLLLPEERELSGTRYTAAAIAVVLGSTFGWVAGYRALQRWQAVPRRRGFNWRTQTPPTPCRNTPRSPFASLLFKELRLQRLNWVLAGCFSVTFALVLWGYRDANDSLQSLNKFYSFVFPVCVGAVTISRERQLGLLEGQLALPVSARRQWAIKMVVCFALSLFGGIAVPWVLLRLHGAFHPGVDHHWFKVFDYSTEVLIFTALAALVSSVARGTLYAYILALCASFVSLIYYGWLIAGLRATQLGQELAWRIGHANPLFVNSYTLCVVALLALVLIVRPTFHRVRHPNDPTSTAFLILRTTILLTVLRLALLFMPSAPT
jgi:hypothetical protein